MALREADGPRRVLHSLDAVDLSLYRRAASADTPVLDAVLPRLTRSADHGRLWVAVAAVLAVAGGRRHRRAALRGLASLSLASATTNLPAKLLTRRTRPDLRPVPLVRHLPRQPTTTSFPSGHSASAGAFVTGVALERPALAAPLAVLGAGVAYGRVHTGVHYPGDVAAGLTLGVLAALAVRRVWPAPPPRDRVEQAPAEAAALPGGAGLTVVLNTAAGDGRGAEELEQALRGQLPAARVVRVPPDDLEQALQDAARTSCALGAAGGDGTVNTAAGIALQHGLPLAVLPLGTLNHFAGELGLRELAPVARAVCTGQAVRVSVGSAAAGREGGLFLNTLSLGVYPDLVHAREGRQDAVGTWPALGWAAARVLRDATPVRVRVADRDRTLWTLFAGNGRYHPSGFAPSWRERLDTAAIDVRLIDAAHPWARSRLVLAVLTGRLARTRVYEQHVVSQLHVRPLEPGLRLTRDGEVDDSPPELHLRTASRHLVVYRPRPAGG
jgi:diacylglycerol kinase family enzyme/membrane-associated phospholipid phosphatase